MLNPATNQLVTKVPQSTQQVLPPSPHLYYPLHAVEGLGLAATFLFRSVSLPSQEMERAVESAKSAFSTWSKTTPLARQQVEETGLLSKTTNKLLDQPSDYVQVPATDKGEPV